MLSTISIDSASPSGLSAYLDEDFERFLHTWDLARSAHGRALEIGSNPYFTTVLLREFTDLDLTLTNSFDPDRTGVDRQTVTYVSKGGQQVSTDLEYESLNVESSPFPYRDETFDVVLFCEVLEHLLMDPVSALNEIFRVLKPNGLLIVTTPNVARFENVARLVAGANIYDPYSGYGPYGRHNREYTRHELVKLLEFCGFDVTDHFTADVHANAAQHFVEVRALESVLDGRLPDLGQYLFTRSHKSGHASNARPVELYRSQHAHVEIRSWNRPAL